ncbi:MAG: YqgE/AlgH family protein [Planctomycetota bacterium]|jgi:putative transcriptional regulator
MTLLRILKTNRRIRKRFIIGGITIFFITAVVFSALTILPAGMPTTPPPALYPASRMFSLAAGPFSSPDSLISQSTLAKGKFLVAGRQLYDPNFSETVILLTSYDWHGAMGLVINRPSDIKLSKMLPDIKGIRRYNDSIYIGGPVERDQLVMIIRSDSQYADTLKVSDDIYVSMSRKVLQQLVKNAETGEKFRVYAGYSGWASGQLEHEVDRGDWHIIDADAETVFDKDSTLIWQKLINRSSAQWVKL